MSSQRPSIIVLLGPPGSGKGTLSQECVQQLGWIRLSTGNLCRKAVTDQTTLGKKIEQAINSGHLVSDDLISGLVHEWLEHQLCAKHVILLDGYPRSGVQAAMLYNFLHSLTQPVAVKVVRFGVGHDTVVKRLTSRLVCGNSECQAVYSADAGSECLPSNGACCDRCGARLVRRNDDTVEVVNQRLQTYQNHEQDILGFYRAKEDVSVLDLQSEGRPESIFKHFCDLVEVHSS